MINVIDDLFNEVKAKYLSNNSFYYYWIIITSFQDVTKFLFDFSIYLREIQIQRNRKSR